MSEHGAVAPDCGAMLPATPLKGSYRIILDREEAIDHALSEAEAGDVVVLAGKGHETYQDIAGSKIPFDEAAIVAARLGRDGE